MKLEIYQVDAFTEKPFSGNPAGVCIMEVPLDGQLMQNIAMEMNVSETAFLVREGQGYQLRWFTPTVEVELCGHATLGSAHALWESGTLKPTEIAVFNTKSGLLYATRKSDLIELDFPAKPETQSEAPPGLLEALKINASYIGKSAFDYLVLAESEEAVRNLRPDFGMLKNVQARGVIVTSRSSSDAYDFVSRFFAPVCGVDEDPVTGSAHCTLATFWYKHLKKNEFTAYQASRRGGVIHVRLAHGRVYLAGNAVTVLKGALYI
jgi:PhzF family phenazine biosynthesis protein